MLELSLLLVKETYTFVLPGNNLFIFFLTVLITCSPTRPWYGIIRRCLLLSCFSTYVWLLACAAWFFLDILCEIKKILQQQYIEKSNWYVYLHLDSFAPILWKRRTLKTLVERAHFFCSTPRLLEKEITHIRTVFRNTKDYHKWIINLNKYLNK